MKELLLQKIQDKSIIAGVVGLGYVGLPLAVEKAKAGFRTIGFDVQKEKVDLVNAGKNYIGDVVDADLAALVEQGMLSATTDFKFIEEVDFGEPIEKTRTINKSDLIITGGSQEPLEGDYAFDNAEIQSALADRKVRLEAQKDKDMSRAASKAAPPKNSNNGFADLGF